MGDSFAGLNEKGRKRIARGPFLFLSLQVNGSTLTITHLLSNFLEEVADLVGVMGISGVLGY
jgi:hypothetical protein